MVAADVMRMLARHHWVRLHGTPRVTTLVGNPREGVAIWQEWLAMARRDPDGAVLHDQPARAGTRWIDEAAAAAVAAITATPSQPVAIAVATENFEAWVRRRRDRISAVVAEGVVRIETAAPSTSRARRRKPSLRPRGPVLAGDARSLAEVALHDALEDTPATRGRFALNQHLSVRFGGGAAEVDLLSRADAIAIEVDGVHHFSDPDCYRRDRRKDLLLQAQGLAVIRVLAEDVVADPRDAVRMVCELLASRGPRDRRTP